MQTNGSSKIQKVRERLAGALRVLEGKGDLDSIDRALKLVKKASTALKQLSKSKRSGSTNRKVSTRGTAHPSVRPRDAKVLGLPDSNQRKFRDKKKKQPARIEGPITCKDCKVKTENFYPDRRCSKCHEAFISSSRARNAWGRRQRKH